MRDLPSGTVTFLFTDVEGSTRLLQTLGAEEYELALGEHRRVLRDAFRAHGGVEVDTQGDAFFVAFPTASGALTAAADAQRSLSEGPIRVRIGVHTGAPLATREGYVGLDVHRAARIAAAGHGGQVVVSEATRALAHGFTLRDLGEHRLKDLAKPERLFQLGDDTFPALKSLYRTNLPVPATPFLGRARELADVMRLLTEANGRLLTLLGPGGTGKTRLALQAAAEAAEAFPDGITWVPLAPLRDPALVLPTVAQALEIQPEPNRRLEETLGDQLAGSRRLLLLDNAEHLLPHVADELAALGARNGAMLLVTSRERLQLQGEQIYEVHPLDKEDGVRLFLTRAASLGLELERSPVVEELCARLDHLPLALELAAPRARLFSPAQLLDRLGQRLDLLQGARDADPRQRTLRATLEWSYDLLETDEQRVLASLSVFAGGCTYEAAEEVAQAGPDALQSLLDKSLLRRRETQFEPRLWMLETIRAFAHEQLSHLHDEDDALERHSRYFATLGDRVYEDWKGGVPAPVYDAGRRLLEFELDDIRVALANTAEREDGTLQLRLGNALALALSSGRGGSPTEARGPLENALKRSENAPAGLRARGLERLGLCALWQGDLAAAEDAANAALELYRRLGDDFGVAEAAMRLGSVTDNPGASRRLFAEAARIFHEHGHAAAIDLDVNQAYAAINDGELDHAIELLERARTTATKHRTWHTSAPHILGNLGLTALLAGNATEAETLYGEALTAASADDQTDMCCYALEGLAESWLARSHAQTDAVRLLGAAQSALAKRLSRPYGVELDLYQRTIQTAKEQLGEQRFSELIEEGEQMTLDDAVALALSLN
jgi:predicted ATPase/class 3 adenylate cyclase